MKVLNIFMVHRVLPDSMPGAVSMMTLRKQLRYLRHHYHVLTCGELIAWLDGVFDTGRPCAAVTFDDGWFDNYLYATPVLRECGVQGILAWSSGFLHDVKTRSNPHQDAAQPSEEACRKALYDHDCSAFLTPRELREMSSSGVWCVQAHGHHHVRHYESLHTHGRHGIAQNDFSLPYALDRRTCPGNAPAGSLVSSLAWPKTRVPDEVISGSAQGAAPAVQENCEAYLMRIRDDMEQNIREIEKHTGKRPALMFWPWGDYSAESLDVARELGFRYTFSVEKGAIHSGTGSFVLPRIGVSEKWPKFVRNSVVFRHPTLTFLRRMIRPSASGLHRITW